MKQRASGGLSSLPKHWSDRSVGSIAQVPLRNGLGESAQPFEPNLPRYIRITDISDGQHLRKDNMASLPTSVAGGALLNEGDLLFAVVGATVGKSYMHTFSEWPGPACFAGYLVRMVPKEEASPGFLMYWTQSADYWAQVHRSTTSATVENLSASRLSRLRVPLPPVEDQLRIVSYLDRETSRIDKLIVKQEQLISLLVERRKVVPSEVLRDSIGVGERLKWYLSEVDERAGHRWPELPLLSVSISWGVKRRDDVTDDLSRAEHLSNYKICRKDNLVVNRMRAFQGAIGIAPEDGLASPDYSVISVGSQLEPEWLELLMRTPDFISEMSSRIRGIGGTDGGNVRTPRLNVQDLLDIEVDVPSLELQHRQFTDWEEHREQIDNLLSKARSFVALTKERRTALITAAVTGQIDLSEEPIVG